MTTKKGPRKVKLEIREPDDNIFLLGIVSHEPIYKLAISLNKRLKLSLKSIDPLKIPDSKENSKTNFTRFADSTQTPDISYYLVSNKSNGKIFLKKFSRIDYFFTVFFSFNWHDLDQLIEEIRNTDGIIALFPLKSNEINCDIFRS